MKIQTCIAASALLGTLVFSQGEAHQGPGAQKTGQEWKQSQWKQQQHAAGQPGAWAQKDAAQKCAPRDNDMWQQALQKFDANKDGRLEGDEKTAAHQWKEQQCAAMKAQQQKQCAEKKAFAPKNDAWQQMLQKFDANRDGQLDQNEKTAAHQWKQQQCAAQNAQKGPQKAGGHDLWQQALQKFDWDGDGQLNESEKQAAMLWKQQQCKK